MSKGTNVSFTIPNTQWDALQALKGGSAGEHIGKAVDAYLALNAPAEDAEGEKAGKDAKKA